MTFSLCSFLFLATAWADPMPRFPDAEPLWVDPDQTELSEKPKEYWSGLMWDGADQTLFAPLHDTLAIEIQGPSANVNSWDEVPNSSWFENRIGVSPLTPAEAAQGACPDVILNPDSGEKWTVKRAKPNGANPGFIIKADDGKYYLLKMDGPNKPPRATTADVFGSKVYWTAGYHTPCNVIVEFQRDIFDIDPEAKAEDKYGRKVPMEQHHIDVVLDKAVELEGGKLRSSASMFIDGRPIGPWTYEGKRKDDPNDVIPHEDRREIRGNRLLAAWLNHFDAREQNTLAGWISNEAGDGGFVRHYYLDWGDCLGSSWNDQPDMLSRRFGHSAYFDPQHVAEDFITFGAIKRTWEHLDVREEAPFLGWYDSEHFDPAAWRSGYRNPAYRRMDLNDGAWMARIIARFTDAHVRALLGESKIPNPQYEEEAFRVLSQRRDKILDHYLKVRSPLADFRLVTTGEGPTAIVELCFTDLAAQTGVIDSDIVRYESRMYFDKFKKPAWERNENPDAPVDAQACVQISGGEMDRPTEGKDNYAILDLLVHHSPGGEPLPPARLHLIDRGGSEWSIVGIERPANAIAPRNAR